MTIALILGTVHRGLILEDAQQVIGVNRELLILYHVFLGHIILIRGPRIQAHVNSVMKGIIVMKLE